MTLPQCWRCDGKGLVPWFNVAGQVIGTLRCDTCNGTGKAPEPAWMKNFPAALPARTVTVTGETFALLDGLRGEGFTHTELIGQIVRWYVADAEKATRKATVLPNARPDDLNERHWHIAILRFEGRVSLDRIGKVFGITRERVRQIEAGIVRKHPEFAQIERQD